MDLAAWGVETGYWDASGHWRDAPQATLDAIAHTMGIGDGPPPPGPPIWFVRAGKGEWLQGPADLVLEDGTVLGGVDAVPPDLVPGYHELRPLDGGPATRLVISPGRCHLPPELRTWGWAVQLYATRSQDSWGHGDLADLRRIAGWAAGQGAGTLALNPLHAGGPALPQQPSPYYPSSRQWRSPLYLRVEEVPGASETGAALEELAASGRQLNSGDRIDRDAVWDLKRRALEACFAHTGDHPTFDRWLGEQGELLTRFATYCAIAELHGNGWQTWPEELRRHDRPQVEKVAVELADRVRFHSWLQWLLDVQVEAAFSVLPPINDLAVGFDPGGADGWAFQDVLALDMRVGAPPDEFNTRGQDWGLPPFDPWKLRAAGYEPLIQTLRSSMRHAGGLRVDHVMGLFRLFWVPEGECPANGTYVRYHASELLDLLALESHRARAFVVGEDLGTVEDRVRWDLAERQVLSYRLLWFEPTPPEHYPEQALAAVTTHDLPTIAGVWTRSDVEDQRSIGLSPNEGGEAEVRTRLQRAAGVDDEAPVDEVVVRAHEALAKAPSQVLIATLEDAAVTAARPNMPGTVDEWPNWSLPLPVTVEELEASEQAAAIARMLSERGRGSSP
ncbi:MAG: 4-alpha-glucanotransferase [Acidimicrobiales bacterium]